MIALSAPWRARMRRWVFKGVGSRSAAFELHYRRIYILPTANGLFFGGVLFVMWLGAINYNNSPMFILAFLLGGMGVVGILHTFRNLVGLRIVPQPPPPVFAGETARFPLLLETAAGRPRWAISLRYGSEIQDVTDVQPRAPGALALQLPAPRRGRLAADRCMIFTVFPTGLLRAWSWIDLQSECLVYPRPEAGAVPPPPGGRGAEQGARRGSGDEDFHQLRRYQPGDSPRQVAWRVVARGQEPRTKQFAGQDVSPIWLDWEPLEGLDVEARLSRLCRWVLDAEAEGRRYGLRLPGLEIPPACGDQHRHQCLQALALHAL